MIMAKEFDALRIIFKVEKYGGGGGGGGSRKSEQLSSLTPFFSGPSASTAKVSASDAIKFLIAVLNPTESGK